MELYFKNSEGQLQETNLRQILSNALKTANFEMDNGSFDGENYKWIGVVQKSKNKTQVVTNITLCFITVLGLAKLPNTKLQ
jgi:hypothetical protein